MGELCVGLVDPVLQFGDVFGADAACGGGRCARRVGGQVGADAEELVLDAAYPGCLGRSFGVFRTEQAEVCVELVDGAVGFEAGVGLGDARASYEGSFPGVAGLRVNRAFFHGYGVG